jgi:hypothetical protein
MSYSHHSQQPRKRRIVFIDDEAETDATPQSSNDYTPVLLVGFFLYVLYITQTQPTPAYTPPPTPAVQQQPAVTNTPNTSTVRAAQL